MKKDLVGFISAILMLIFVSIIIYGLLHMQGAFNNLSVSNIRIVKLAIPFVFFFILASIITLIEGLCTVSKPFKKWWDNI